jgi:2-dehydro-3-deoxyphosphogluconate aldolase/(4S)-4-hydroxy-2-oxoglutarate aldolase
MPTGGVDISEENLASWFKAGVTCVGMGSQLLTKDFVDNAKWGELTSNCAKVLAIIQRYKK